MQWTGERESRRDRYRRIRSRASQQIGNGADYIRGLVPPVKGPNSGRPEGRVLVNIRTLKNSKQISHYLINGN